MELVLLQSFGFLIVGFFILVISGDALVRASISTAKRLHIKPIIIGLTIVAAGTSAPELMTSLIAAYKETPDIALGNVVGSNIFNILGVIGISCLIRPNFVEKSLSKFEIPALLIFTILLTVFCWSLTISKIEGLFFLACFILFLFLTIRRAKLHPVSVDSELEQTELLKSKWLDVLFLALGFLGLAIGAHLAVKGGISIGRYFGLSERIIGITIISIGTGLPELATSVVAAYRGRNDIAIANVIGSNIMNILMVIGGTATLFPLTVDPKILSVDSVVQLLATILLLPTLYITKGYFSRKVGFFYLMSYLGYIVYLIYST